MPGWDVAIVILAAVVMLWAMRLSNCLVVSLLLWGISRFRATLWLRRSLTYRGMIPHFGTAHRVGFKTVLAIEGIPSKRDKGTMRDLLLVFRVGFRVWELRVVRVYRVRSLDDAISASFGRTDQAVNSASAK